MKIRNVKRYEILPHSAELRLRIYGKTLEELFINAVLALAQTLKNRLTRIRRGQAQKKEKIKIQSVDVNSLLVDFLSEILSKSQINKKVYRVKFLKFHPEGIRPSSVEVPAEGLHYLEAELIGFPIERFDEDVKAVTYEDLDICRKPKAGSRQLIWQTDLVFDI